MFIIDAWQLLRIVVIHVIVGNEQMMETVVVENKTRDRTQQKNKLSRIFVSNNPT
jgi:hypothetical protein